MAKGRRQSHAERLRIAAVELLEKRRESKRSTQFKGEG
jgi:hypothetical protein